MKILTPNSLEDEDSTNSMLSQEEVEAFQNMIVNLLVSGYCVTVATPKDCLLLISKLYTGMIVAKIVHVLIQFYRVVHKKNLWLFIQENIGIGKTYLTRDLH